ncbi:YceI family protein [Pontibacter sp. SGAir0037]|uniref:YceI family protein n=1 Tax=Pontibacter sp. SGAir0037 TaxID=2571030 RepID=UPI0010CD4F48|nr:YceI family protein [Pontibacter sp. SGAir0037]QCR23237.1 lipid-binding protein [Pontibacter sp. SGAir0037]
MKKTTILAAFATALIFSACGDNANNTADNAVVESAEATETATAEGDTYAVDTEQSNVKWHGTKVTGEHNGNIELQSGELTVANNQVTGGTIVIDMNTITNEDITDAKYNSDLVNHLKSDDFFGAEKYPTATFNITSLTPIASAAPGEANYTATGNLTIKDKTNPVTFPVYVTVENNEAKAKADVTVNRAQYDVRYGSNSFFENLGDKAISDDFTVSFDIVAKK